MMYRVAGCSVFAALFVLNANAPMASRTERLARLAELDGAVRYFHPDVVNGTVHWDSLLAARAVAIADAPSPGEYHRRIAELMQRLGDPATYVVEKPRSWSASVVDSVLIIRAGGTPARAADVRSMLSRASAVVADVRGGADGPPADIMALLFTGSVRASDAQGWRYEGFLRQSECRQGVTGLLRARSPVRHFLGRRPGRCAWRFSQMRNPCFLRSRRRFATPQGRSSCRRRLIQ